MCRRNKEAGTYAIVLLVLFGLLLPLHALLTARERRDDGDQGGDCMLLWYMLHFQNAKSAEVMVQGSWSIVLAASIACVALSVVLTPIRSPFSISHEPPADILLPWIHSEKKLSPETKEFFEHMPS